MLNVFLNSIEFLRICNLNATEIKSLQTAVEFRDIFSYVEKVCIHLKPYIITITDVLVDNNNNIILADGWKMKKVILFNSSGALVKEIPIQDYTSNQSLLSPVSITQNRDNEYLILDYLNRDVIFFDSTLTFIKKYNCPFIGHYIRVDSDNNYFLYSSYTKKFAIHKYNGEGKFLLSFCSLPVEITNVQYFVAQNGILVTDDNLIFEMNPLVYRIRKYSTDGKLIKSFSRKVNFYRQIKEFSANGKNSDLPTLVNGPFYLQKKFILAEVNNYLEIYGKNGNFWVGGLKLPGKILYAKGSELYIECRPPDDEETKYCISRYKFNF